MKDIITATWGVGKSYRDRIKHNITKAVNTGYDNIIPYIILTDKPEDFYEIQDKTGKIEIILNIHEEIDKYSPWSKDLEHIAKNVNEEEYGKKYREINYTEDKVFSYGLNRFSLPEISKMGYNKFLLCDSDTDIRYDKIVNKQTTEEMFWKEYDTPTNSMKGCDYEEFNMSRDGNWNKANVVMACLLRYHLHTKYPQHIKPSILKLDYTQTEGPFRYYNLENSDKVMDVFTLWDESMRFLLSEPQTRAQLCPGRYMYIDNVPFSITNELLGIQFLNFDKFWHKVNIYLADRYFFPKGHSHTVNGRSLSLQPANNKEEFYKKNEELINHFKLNGQWID